jgi:hypothetical protein
VVAEAVAQGTDTVCMIPGDSRDSVTGCALQPNDYYENSGVWIDRLAEQHAESIRQEGFSEQ